MPQQWNELWEMLPGRRRVGVGWKPSAPLILGAWREVSAEDKRERLESHIRYAAEHGVLGQIDQYLRNLSVDLWAYGDGTAEWTAWQKNGIGDSYERDWLI